MTIEAGGANERPEARHARSAYDEYGDPNGTPVIFNHGLSDSRAHPQPRRRPDRVARCRMLAADQPGVGGSSPSEGPPDGRLGQGHGGARRRAGLTEFAVVGHSGGSPHALAIAHRLPERVTKIVLASPVAPLDEKGMGKLMINKDLKLFAKLHHLHHLIKWASNYSAKKAEKDIPSFVEATANDDKSDRDTFLNDPAQRADVRGVLHRRHDPRRRRHLRDHDGALGLGLPA